ncbi:hypothetical protein D5086_027700 [Populus alba]|uniref:Uncharacterized protein n=1 Tax=Populus alba TaxID=43335 RepID=A0ACC4AWM2_POPAL
MGLMGVSSGDGEDVISITADLIVSFSSLTSMIVYLPSRTINNTLVQHQVSFNYLGGLKRRKKNEELDRIFLQVDDQGNSARHLAAATIGDYKPWRIPGAALQLQWEIKWYKVEKKWRALKKLGTHLPEIHDSIALMLNSKLVHIQLDEIDLLRYLEAKGISYSMAEFQTTLLQGDSADSDSDDEVYTDLAFDLAGDDNICRLGIADKNCGSDDKGHTMEVRKHNRHGTYEVYDHSFAATINAIDNTERLHIIVEDLFPEIAAPRTPHHYPVTFASQENTEYQTLKPEQKTILLHSIANYLENTGGFSKTLKKFKSEAKFEMIGKKPLYVAVAQRREERTARLQKDDLGGGSLIDLEEAFCKFLKTR